MNTNIAIVQPAVDLAQLARDIQRDLIEYRGLTGHRGDRRALRAAEEEVKRLREQQRRRRQELGRLLILARQDPGMEHGGWESFLGNLGITIERASEWMHEAELVAEMVAECPLKPGVDHERHAELAKNNIALLAGHKATMPPIQPLAPRPPSESRHIYFVQPRGGGPIKIGITSSVERRLKELQSGHPEELRVIGSFMGTQKDEARLHRELSRHRLHSEWFADSDEVRAAITRETK